VSAPLVSILVPTYNGERFLRPALRSALDQSYRDIEVVVGDDASTDRTPEILSALAASDPRVRVVRHEPNVGAYENPIRLLREARGEYVKFLLHDDVLATDCVRDLVRGMEANPAASMAFSRRVLIGEDGRPVPGHEFPQLMDRPGLIDGRELGDAMLEACSNVVGELTTVLFRRDDVESTELWAVDGRRLDVLADLSLWLRLLSRGPAFYTPRPLSRFRMHPSQHSQNPRFIARGMRDWPRLIDWATRHGYLTDGLRERRAYTRALEMAAARVGQLVAGGDHGAALDAVFLSTARLVELGAELPVAADAGLAERAHGAAVLSRFGQELDVWTRTFPVALAAPALTPGEIEATVRALREVRAADAAKQLVIAVAEPLVAEAVPLVEAALAQGPELDVDLVPTADPAALLSGEWLAVAPWASGWHVGKATAVWSFAVEEPPRQVRGESGE
jgi:glycosyltransferase involved in cell wall biosynthesis